MPGLAVLPPPLRPPLAGRVGVGVSPALMDPPCQNSSCPACSPHALPKFVMAGLVPDIHVLLFPGQRTWMAGTSARSKASSPRPAMTVASHSVLSNGHDKKHQFVLATLGGEGAVMNAVACSIAGPKGVGIFTQNGTRMRVPAIGANAISIPRWAVRYLITGRSGIKPATGEKYSAQTTAGPRYPFSARTVSMRLKSSLRS